MNSRVNFGIKFLLSAGFLFIIFFTNATFAQVSQVWANRYNGTANLDDGANDIQIDNSGNVYVTGGAKESGTGMDVVTSKYNSSGMLMWLTKYHAEVTDKCYSLALDPSNPDNIYVVGTTEFGTGTNGLILKYNSTGAFQWSRRVTVESAFLNAVVDIYGNLYAAGYNRVVKYNTFGTLLWSVSSGCRVSSLALDGTGNAFVTGWQASTNDIFTAKFSSSSGSVLWSQRYINSGADESNKIAIDVSGNVYITGSINSGSYSDLVFIKYNSTGGLLWVKTYNGSSSTLDVGKDMKIDGGGNIIIAGWSGGGYPSTISSDYLILKYDSFGSLLWSKLYNSPLGRTDWIWSLDLDNLGNIYVTGRTGNSSTLSTANISTIKYNSGGIQQWLISYGSPAYNDNFANKIRYKNGFIYVSGHSMGATSGYDYVTIKYSQSGSSRPLEVSENSIIPSEFKLYDNYPNPFNPATKIKFDIAKPSDVKLVVYDILGKVIVEQLFENTEAGQYEYDWDASQLSAGIYFSRLIAGDFTDTKKMILVK